MNSRLIYGFFFPLVFSILLLPLVLRAQTEPEPDFIFDTSGSGEESCFDYYRFQSVDVSISPDKEEYSSGDTVVFTGELINENNYPITEGSIFVRLSRFNENYIDEGHFVIDEFIAVNDLTVDSKERIPFSFSWKIPSNASGKYILQSFFLVGGRFELSGLPFSNEIVAGAVTFNVGNKEDQEGIIFDRSKTTVDGVPYRHIGEWPHITEGKEALIRQPITNTENTARSVSLTYDFSYWDNVLAEYKLETKKEEVVIPAQGEINLSYTTPTIDRTVSYITITARVDDDTSIVHIRLVSDGISPRFNYLGLSTFPLREGSTATLFGCFHNTSNDPYTGRAKLTLFDEKNNIIGESTKEGEFGGNVELISKEVMISKKLTRGTLRAELLDPSGMVYDSYDMVYDCEKMKTNVCNILLSEKGTVSIYVILGGVVLVLVIIGLLSVYFNKKENENIPQL